MITELYDKGITIPLMMVGMLPVTKAHSIS